MKMAKRPNKWQAKTHISEHKGALHKQLGIPEDQPISTSTLAKLQHKSGKLGQRVRYALVTRGYYGKHKPFKHHHGPLSAASLAKRRAHARRRARHGTMR